MEDLEIIQELSTKLDNLTKQVAKLLNINTKIAKVLHLLPVTEKEEKALQILQRKNLQIAAKVNDELNDMENKTVDEYTEDFKFEGSIFGDVLGDDFL